MPWNIWNVDAMSVCCGCSAKNDKKVYIIADPECDINPTLRY